MEVNRVDRLTVEFKDMNSGIMIQRTFAEVIFIDRTNSSTIQICYILRNDKIFNDADIENFTQGQYTFSQDDFIQVGEVIIIDKRQKFVILKNQNSISYNHLIIASGSHNSLIYEFIAGVHTLVDAIRVRKKIPSAFAETRKSIAGKRKMKSSKTNSSDLNFPKKIDNVKTRKMGKQRENESSCTLNNPNKRLYEVQI